MHKEVPDKLLITVGNHTMGVTGFSATGTEGCVCIRDRDDSAVRDSNPCGYSVKDIFCRQTIPKVSRRSICEGDRIKASDCDREADLIRVEV